VKSRRAHTHCRPQTARPQLQMKYHPELPRPHIAVYGTGRKATSIDQLKLTAVVATKLLAHTRSFCQTLSPIRTALSTIVRPGDPVPGVYDEEFSDRLLLSSRNSKHSSLCLGMQRLWIQTSSQSGEQAREEALSFRKARRSLVKRIDFRRCVSMRKISFYISVIECVCVCAR